MSAATTPRCSPGDSCNMVAVIETNVKTNAEDIAELQKIVKPLVELAAQGRLLYALIFGGGLLSLVNLGVILYAISVIRNVSP